MSENLYTSEYQKYLLSKIIKFSFKIYYIFFKYLKLDFWNDID